MKLLKKNPKLDWYARLLAVVIEGHEAKAINDQDVIPPRQTLIQSGSYVAGYVSTELTSNSANTAWVTILG